MSEPNNGTAARTVKSDVAAMQARLDALRDRSFKTPPSLEAESRIAREINEQEERLDKEGEEALEAYAVSIEASMRAKLGPTVALRAVYSWPVHKATAGDTSSIERILETGRGLIVVRGATGKAAVKCAAALGAAGSTGRSGLFVNRPEDVEVVLRNAAVWPELAAVNEMLTSDSLSAFMAAAAREAADLAGTWASTTLGKSKG